MSEREQVVVRVSPDGIVHAETRGIKGPACLDQIQLLEDLLDATTHSSSFTSEYNEVHLATKDEVTRELGQY